MATALIEIVDEGNNLVYMFDHEEDLEDALDEVDGDIGMLSEIAWVPSRPRNSTD